MSYGHQGSRPQYQNPQFQAPSPYAPPPRRRVTKSDVSGNGAAEVEAAIRITYAFNDSVSWNSSSGVLWAIHDFFTRDEAHDERN